MNSNSIVDPNTYNTDIWKKYFEYGEIYFKEGHLKFYDFSFTMIHQLGPEVIPMLKSIYLDLVNNPANSNLLVFTTLYKDVKKMDIQILKNLTPLSTQLNNAISMIEKLPEPLLGLDKEYFIKDCIEDEIKNLSELTNLIQLLSNDLLDRLVYLAYKDKMVEPSKADMNADNHNITDFEQLCLTVYSNEVGLYPVWRNLLLRPSESAAKILQKEEINIIEFDHEYKDDFSSIVNEYTISYLRRFKTKKLEKLKGLI